LYLTNVTNFQVTGAPLRSRDHAADDVTNVNFGFKQFATSVGIYVAKNPLCPWI